MLIHGRYDESRGDPQIIAEALSLDFNAALPDDSFPEPHDDIEPAWAESAAEPPDAIMAALASAPPPGFDELPLEPSLPDEYDIADAPSNGAPLDTSLVEPETAPEGEPEWVNGDGHLALPGEEKAQERVARAISVTLVTSEDPDRDRRKLRHIHNTLVSYPGVDRFRIIVLRGADSTPLDFPDQTTNICEALCTDLVEIVGSDDYIDIDSQT